ncbi:MAG: FG-GAP-like repeat-containing protein, partial [Acidimicrobiales bacterium]
MSGHLLLRRIATACLAAVAVVAVLAPAAPAHASGRAAAATVADDELSFLRLLNQERVAGGLSPLVSDSRLAPTSRSWSGHMAGQDRLSHDPNLAAIAAQVEPNWRSVGENVGVGYSVQSLHNAFMGSSGHRANVMKSSYNRVGVGVVHAGDKIWVTVRFLQGPAISGTTGLGPPPPPPGVRTTLTGDFDGDGRGDLLTYGPGSSTDELWFGRSNRTLVQRSVSVSGASYRPVAGDFDGNGRTDVLWYVPGSGSDVIWTWNGTGWTSRSVSISGTYTPMAGDFDGDGRDDIFWYAPGSAADTFWFGSSSGAFTSVATQVTGTYTPRAGDFDGNGRDDILWYAPGSGADAIWYMSSSRGARTSRSITVNGSFRPVVGDFDASGTDDVFWYAP